MRGGSPQEIADVLARARAAGGAPPLEAESPLERFERLAEEFRQETGFLAPGKDYPPGAYPPPDSERAQRWATWLKERRIAAAASPDPEPPPNGPEDLGFRAPAPPRHDPKLCADCNAPILWAQQLDDDGQRIWNDERKRWRSMPVDFRPDPEGNVQVFHREGEGIVCRVYRDAAAAPAGAILRTNHFQHCPNAKNRRKKGNRR